VTSAPPLGLPGPAGLVGAEAAFYVVFGIFVVAFAVLVVITMRWAVRRDRSGRAEWLRRRQEDETSNGHRSPQGGRRRPPG